jgi:hypothetical protein
VVKGALRPALRLPERWSVFGQAGAAALDRAGPGADGVASVVTAYHQRAGHEQQPEDQVRYGVSAHASTLQLERLADGDEGRRLAAVEDNVPILRRSAAWVVLHAVGTATAEPAAIEQIGAPRGLAVGAQPLVGRYGPQPCDKAHRAVAARCMWAMQVVGDELHGS